MPNQQLTCASCSRRFTWSAGEQQFYRERGLHAPRRCLDCRSSRREQTTAKSAGVRPAAARPEPMARRPAPRRVFGMRMLVAAVVVTVALFLLTPSAPVLAWLIAMNLVALLAYGYDKAIAGSGQMRVPEVVLLGLALLGGSLGAFAGMVLFRHKTSKPAFLVPFFLIVVLQVAVLIAWLVLRQP